MDPRAEAINHLTAYTAAVHATARELGLPVDVNVVRVDDGASPLERDQHHDPILERLHETAVARTPLPNSGIAPKDYPDGPLIADADRAAGNTYRARAARGTTAAQ